MRTVQKNQIEDAIKLLDKAHIAIKEAIETGSQEIALTLLEQCQDSAIQMGSLIEETEGEGFTTVGLLENYCEQVYQIYELIRQQKSVNTGKMYKNLRRELIRIENSVKNDIKVRTVAVFLPYKASMWDSLESIWLAADADPDCDAYVVPIPYCDKNPDGSFKEMHYEGNEYPNYVPIISWEKYDIVIEHPDIIFIHNPYDEFNLITSVLPAYYSKELKKHTDKLVYVPYFILEEVDPANKEAVEGVENFCEVPAVIHADKVIVQSEKMRQIYINIMSKAVGEDTRSIWDAKILGLGSPKIDRVLHIRKGELDVPEEWLRIIKKPDESWKKIVFYNTSVSAFLQHSEKMIRKIEDVFETFKENRETVALLWRPHPLIKATIKSMRPQLWEEYDKIVERYREEGWGIYDDTSDVNRAIEISDAYYGDPSSIVQMYQQTGRPMMLQNVMAGKYAKENKLEIEGIYFYNCIIYANKLWFVSTSHYFMNMDVETGQTSYVDWEERDSWKEHAVLDKMLTCGTSIYWLDRDRNSVHEYNAESNEYCYYPLPEVEENVLGYGFAGIYVYEDMIYFFLRNTLLVLRFDLRQKKWETYSELYLNWTSENVKRENLVCSVQVCHWIYLFQSCGVIVKFNLDNFQHEYITIPDELSNIIRVVWKNNKFYLLLSTGDVYIWDGKGENVEKIYSSLDTGRPFGEIYVTEHKMFLLPNRSEKILIVDLQNYSIINQAECPEDIQYIDNTDGKYGAYTEDESYVWCDKRRANYILRINKKDEKIEWLKMRLPSVQEEWFYRKKRGEIPMLYEKAESLERLMQTDDNEKNNTDVKGSENIGETIWNALKEV